MGSPPPGAWRGRCGWWAWSPVPERSLELAKLELEIRQWEDHSRTLAKRFRETFSNIVKVGILLQMLPKQARDFVLQAFGNGLKYEEIVKRVRTFVANKVAMTVGSGPGPVDVGEISCGVGRRGGLGGRGHRVAFGGHSVSWMSGLGARAPQLPHGCREPAGLAQRKG